MTSLNRDRSDDGLPCWMISNSSSVWKLLMAFFMGGFLFHSFGSNSTTVILTDERSASLRSHNKVPPFSSLVNHQQEAVEIVTTNSNSNSNTMIDSNTAIDSNSNVDSKSNGNVKNKMYEFVDNPNRVNPDVNSDCPFVPPSKNSLDWGGWEYNLEFIKTHHIATSPVMARWMVGFMKEKGMKSLLDVGCGVGQFKVALEQEGATFVGDNVKKNGVNVVVNNNNNGDLEYMGMDGGSNIMQLEGVIAPVGGNDKHRVPHLCWVDASVPFDLLRKFDLVYSNEVAEHIPRKGEQYYLDNLVLHLNDNGYLLLGWARIGQGGFHHVNERDATYAIEQVEKRGMVFDNELTENFRAQFVTGSGWKKNSFFFQKRKPQ